MKNKIDKNTLKRLINYIKKYYSKQFLLVIFCIIVSTVASVSSSIFFKTLIDKYIVPLLAMENPIFDGLFKANMIMVLIYLSGIITGYVYSRMMAVISQGVLKEVRDDMFAKMQKLPISYFDTHTHGDVMSHYTNDADTLRQMISQSLPQFISSVVSIVVVFGTMCYISIELTIFIILFLFVMLFVAKNITKRSAKYFIKQQKSLATVNGYIEEMTNGQKVVKVFCYEDKAKERFNKVNDELYENMYQANKFANVLMPIMGNLGNLEYVLTAIIGGYLAIKGNNLLTVGSIASFLTLIKSFNMPIQQISQQMNSIIVALAGATRIFSLMDQKEEVDEGKVTLVKEKDKWFWMVPKNDEVELVELKGHVIFEDINFSYIKDKNVLNNINLYAKPGQKIAFVGHTGAGKTTITNLLNRFYDVDDGRILYDGIDIKDIKKADLRKSLGMVLQDTNLFTGTIADNIRYGKENATMEEVINACKIANADSFIERLPEGYNTMIYGNGSSLSQGQRQLLSIARAAICNPPVMVLDEATSSIDTRTEKIVQDGMDKLMENRTVFVIAHRLSTIRNAKAIVVLENGNIIEKGDHQSLLNEKGKYYQLYTGKFELE